MRTAAASSSSVASSAAPSAPAAAAAASSSAPMSIDVCLDVDAPEETFDRSVEFPLASDRAARANSAEEVDCWRALCYAPTSRPNRGRQSSWMEVSQLIFWGPRDRILGVNKGAKQPWRKITPAVWKLLRQDLTQPAGSLVGAAARRPHVVVPPLDTQEVFVLNSIENAVLLERQTNGSKKVTDERRAELERQTREYHAAMRGGPELQTAAHNEEPGSFVERHALQR